MTTGQILTNDGKKILLNRGFKASPNYTVPSLFKVGTGTTAPTVTDTDLQAAVIISGGNTTKAFATGYPILDETNLQITIRTILLTTDANGNSLTEFGIFNSDTSKLMSSRAVFTAITKTSSVQVIFVEKILIR